MEKEMKRLMKLKRKVKTYKEFETEIRKHREWYVGEGDTRLKLDTWQDVLALYRYLGG